MASFLHNWVVNTGVLRVSDMRKPIRILKTLEKEVPERALQGIASSPTLVGGGSKVLVATERSDTSGLRTWHVQLGSPKGLLGSGVILL